MDSHLVAIKVGVESSTHEWVQTDRVPFDKGWLKRLYTHAVKRRSTVEHHRVVRDDFIKDVPDLFILTLKHSLRRFNRVCVPEFFKPANNERLKQFQGDLLRQTTLMKMQFWPDDNHTSG